MFLHFRSITFESVKPWLKLQIYIFFFCRFLFSSILNIYSFSSLIKNITFVVSQTDILIQPIIYIGHKFIHNVYHLYEYYLQEIFI